MERLTTGSGLRRSGLFFAVFCFFSAIYNVFQQLFEYHHHFPEFLLHSHALINLGLGGLFIAGAYIARLFWIQPLVILAYVPEPLLAPDETFYGLGLFVMGIVLLFRLGFFERHRILKLIASLAYLYTWVVLGVMRAHRNLVASFTPMIFMTMFLVFFYLVFKEKLAVYLYEPRAKLSLEAKGLAVAERKYVLEVIASKSSKEIAFDFEVSESTVRNTLARAYKKLGVEDKAGLAALAGKYDLVD